MKQDAALWKEEGPLEKRLSRRASQSGGAAIDRSRDIVQVLWRYARFSAVLIYKKILDIVQNYIILSHMMLLTI